MSTSEPAVGAAPAPLEVDRESLLELARGGNLYQDRFACMRELVQNAVDATLLRIYVDRGADAFPTHEGSMRELRAALEAYPIDVTIARLDDEGTGDDAIHRYRVAVEDRGTGIAPEDVPHLQRIGSSRKNPARAALIESMPEWMRPSGVFGIGLQSAFLASDELVLRSLHTTGRALDITLRARAGGTVQVLDGARETTGTLVEMVVHIGPRDRQVGVASHAVARVRRAVDWLVDPIPDEALLGALDLAQQMARGAVVPVSVNGVGARAHWSGAGVFFDPETLVEIELPSTDDGAKDASDPLADDRNPPGLGPRFVGNAFYRGAPIQAQLTLDAIPWRYNLHFGSARQMLSLSREQLTHEGRLAAHARAVPTLMAQAKIHLARLTAEDAAPHVRCWLSCFLRTADADGAGDDWRRVAIIAREAGPAVTLGELEQLGELTLETPHMSGEFFDAASRRRFAERVYVLPTGERIPAGFATEDGIEIALPGLSLSDPGLKTWRRGEGCTITNHYMHGWLQRLSARSHIPRPELPCPDDYHAVAIPDIWRGPPGLHRRVLRVPEFVSPWTFRDGLVDLPRPLRWIEWNAKEHRGPPRDPAAVAAILVRFLREFDPDLRANRELTVVYDLDAKIAEIEAAFPSASA